MNIDWDQERGKRGCAERTGEQRLEFISFTGTGSDKIKFKESKKETTEICVTLICSCTLGQTLEKIANIQEI